MISLTWLPCCQQVHSTFIKRIKMDRINFSFLPSSLVSCSLFSSPSPIPSLPKKLRTQLACKQWTNDYYVTKPLGWKDRGWIPKWNRSDQKQNKTKKGVSGKVFRFTSNLWKRNSKNYIYNIRENSLLTLSQKEKGLQN